MSSLPNLKKLRQIANETDKMLKKSPLRDRTVTFQHNTSTSSHLEEVQREINEIDRELEDDDLELSDTEEERMSLQQTGQTLLTPSSKNESRNISPIRATGHRQPSPGRKPPESPSFTNSRNISMETRLKGATSTIKLLETQARERDEQIVDLEGELKRRQKLVDSFQSQAAAIPNYQRSVAAQSTVAHELARRESELESRINSQDEKIAGDKRSILKLQETNNRLLESLKGGDKVEHNSSPKRQKTSSLQEKNRQLKGKNRQLEIERDNLAQEVEMIKRKYNDMMYKSMDFEEKTRELYKSSQILNESVIKMIG